MKNLLVLNKYFLRYKWRFLLGILFVLFSNIFGILIPQEIRKALDYVNETLQSDSVSDISAMSEPLLIFTGTVIGLSLTKGVMMYFMRQTIIVVSRLIEYDLRRDIYEHLQRLDTAFYKRSKTGDLMSRITEDVDKVRMYLGPCMLYGINLTCLFIVTIYSMFSANVKLSLYTLLPMPLLSISIYYVSQLINDRSSIIQRQLGVLTSNAQESYSGIRVLKSYVKEKQFDSYFGDEADTFRAKSIDLARVNALFFPLMVLLVSISTLLVVYIGGQEVVASRLTAGTIAEFIIYVNMLTWPVTSIGWIASLVQQAEASQKRINELLEEEPTDVEYGKRVTSIRGVVEFKNVSFTYKDTGIKALDNVSFKIKSGEKLAIMGRTASGKTTIAELLLKMYEPDSGSILLDDIPLDQYAASDLRRLIGYVPQDVFLFSDNIKNNIAFGVENASIQEIERYANYASIHEEITDLPESYDTLVGERGVNLSGGQKQRVSIARALIKKPQLLILDDSLSAVDPDTEKKIFSYLQDELSDRTLFMITHRVHSVAAFDHIIILDEGRVAQAGNHESLSRSEGYYADMIMQQEGNQKRR